MKHKQLKLRLEALVIKDKQSINGYRLAVLNAKDVYKCGGYQSVVIRLKTSIERKQNALMWIEANYMKSYNWENICRRFGFREYKR